MSNARGALSLLLVLAAGLMFAPSARADSQVRIVRLSLVSGPVQIDRGSGFEKAIMNMPIAQGMRLWTQGDSRAEVEFEDGATMRLAPGAKVDFPQLTLLSSGAKASTVNIAAGRVYFNVPHKGDNEFTVAFGGRQLNLSRSVHFRLDITSDQAEIAVFKGELLMPSGDKETKVKKNETATLDHSVADKGTFQLAKGITPGPYDEWDAYRLQFDSEYASAGSKNVPYYYGRSDLNYYGSWGYIPGYGDLWRPFGFGYAWDPFASGAWAWYPGWGYTWVSSYPWGWIPYRYGNWIWVPNYGWCWRPGAFVAGFAPVANAPVGYVGPQPPPVTLVASTGGTAPAPHPPTVTVGPGPRRRLDKDGNLILGPADGGRARSLVGATTVPSTGTAATAAPIAPTTSTTTAIAPAATAPTRPARTSVPRSGPGYGRRPVALDDTGVAAFGSYRVREGGARPTTGLGAPPSPRSSGAQPSASRVGTPGSAARSAPSASRMSAPASSRPSAPPPRPSNPK